MDKSQKKTGKLISVQETHLTTTQAAEEVGVTRQGLIQAISNGKLIAKKIDGRFFISREDIKQYLKLRWRRDTTRDESGNLVFNPEEGNYSIRQATEYLRKEIGARFKPNRLYMLITKNRVKYTKYGCAYILSKQVLDQLILLEKNRFSKNP